MTDRELPLNMQKRFLAAQSVLGVDEPSGLMPEDYNNNLRLEAYLQESDKQRRGENAPWLRSYPDQSEAAWKAQDIRDQRKLLALKLMLLDQE